MLIDGVEIAQMAHAAFTATTGGAEPAWYPDPSGRHELRYHDGARWTEHVSDDGHPALDPV